MAGDPSDVSVLFSGLPGTGKTTYLALLYLAISSGRTTDLRLGGYTDDREYANRIAKKLLACEEIAHTETAERRRLSLSLEIGAGRDPARLEVPDLSGETWEDAVYERAWPRWLEAAARSATGTLVFVHVTNFEAAPSIAAVHTNFRALGEEGGDPPPSADADPEGGVSHTRSRSQPTQVQIVDMLQLLCEERSARPARAGIVLSAWDLTDEHLTPSDWLKMNAPLADQYLRANRSWLSATVWGVSAQGGSFKDEPQRATLLEQDAVDRARVVAGDGTRCPVEGPLSWVMSRET